MTGLPNTGICDREHTSDRHICENEKHTYYIYTIKYK